LIIVVSDVGEHRSLVSCSFLARRDAAGVGQLDLLEVFFVDDDLELVFPLGENIESLSLPFRAGRLRSGCSFLQRERAEIPSLHNHPAVKN
jgi:hypothetical protein